MSIIFNTEDCFKDAVGNVILPNDLIRMKHFRTKGKRYFMYKQAVKYKASKDRKTKSLYFRHYDGEGGFHVMSNDMKILNDMVVVQRGSFYNNPKIDELKRSRVIRD